MAIVFKKVVNIQNGSFLINVHGLVLLFFLAILASGIQPTLLNLA